ncbi:unnamed protein product [Bursaphelenchus okinawaensis]|uniref:Uncharacterized protein n=1 Tax=Bursaphelenchus okinawaensis TaxID=465554 RepID=A0A811L3C8_9BILA|nr:unnamed protein product [Bursaphelenchus okinawaensis]CAG9118299.1 unnamed protein product [Bursaphelenchus okinawaensis]
MDKTAKKRILTLMGVCESSNVDARRNKEINDQIEKDRRLNDSTVKLLLLGAGESGKSTILKQMKIIHDNGYTEADAIQKKSMVYANVIQAMHYIVQGIERLGLNFSNSNSAEHARLIDAVIKKNKEGDPIADNVYMAIKELTMDKAFKKAMDRKTEFYMPDSSVHFIDSLDRICNPSYIPSQQDILLLRISTMGVIEVTFKIKDKMWRVFDVGGQRSQRKKWIHCFDDARAVIFVVALSEYDQVLIEDNTTNRMLESIQLFKQVCNNKHFIETSIILFLNKKDLFREKIEENQIPLKKTFPEYSGELKYEPCVKYIEKKFFMANEVPNKNIYCHQTCATDTEQVQFVLDSVMDTILSSKLKGCGLY